MRYERVSTRAQNNQVPSQFVRCSKKNIRGHKVTVDPNLFWSERLVNDGKHCLCATCASIEKKKKTKKNSFLVAAKTT